MVFELTDALGEAIAKALENQDKNFLVDAKNSALVEYDQSVCPDDDRYYELPPWDSADGFSLMESFVNDLHSPLAYTDLQAALHSGKGVFRGFKDVLKRYPLIERRWHYFKGRALLSYVNSWYNSLRESWGLEKLDSEPDETEDLLLDDFTFSEYSFERDRQNALELLNQAVQELGHEFAADVAQSFGELWLSQFDYNAQAQKGFVCKTFGGDFAGCVVWSPCPKNSSKAVLIEGLFVEKNCRGLGIARALFERALDSLQAAGAQWVIIANTFVPDLMQGMLNRSGFKKIGSTWIADFLGDLNALQ
ncbi:MAG: GNAT family N-acetyltransferase [Treponema sp.]|jgi:GNAT superfamily N-acetyltransferase|nr:GNAT family N-acetyltransferase [Treponema sp.]